MADPATLFFPPGVSAVEARAWACSALDGDEGQAFRRSANPATADVMRAWEKGVALATNAGTGKVLYAKDIEPGWTMYQCQTGKDGKDCSFLKDRLKKPVAFPRHVLTFDCSTNVAIPSLKPSDIPGSAAIACAAKDVAESRITKANKLRRAAAHTELFPQEMAVNRDRGLVQVATRYQRGWKLVSCPEEDSQAKDCRFLMRLKAVTLPEDAVTEPCLTAAPVGQGKETLIPYLPDPRPWNLEYNDKGGHDVVIDLDTIGVVRGVRHERIRFVGVNGPECKGHAPDKEADHYEQRCLNAKGGAEWGANEGREALVKILQAHRNQVYLAEHGHEGYGRLLATVFVKNPDGAYLNVNAELIRQGWGMYYMIAPDNVMLDPSYIPAHLEARRLQIGLYGAPDSVRKYRGPLYMPSYHPKASSKSSAQKPEGEYSRIFNIGAEPVDLGDYVIVDARSGKQFPLPSMILPVGFGVQIFPASGTTNSDPLKGPLVINLGRPAGVYWSNDSALLVQKKQGDKLGPIITAIAGTRGRDYLPAGF